jgi:hypothetical protein
MEKNLTKERRGEIAIFLLRDKIKKEGMTFSARKDFDKRIKELARKSEFSENELEAFLEEELRKALNDFFSGKKD